MKRVMLEFWMPDEDEPTELNIGKALGVAIVSGEFYASVIENTEEEEDEEVN